MPPSKAKKNKETNNSTLLALEETKALPTTNVKKSETSLHTFSTTTKEIKDQLTANGEHWRRGTPTSEKLLLTRQVLKDKRTGQQKAAYESPLPPEACLANFSTTQIYSYIALCEEKFDKTLEEFQEIIQSKELNTAERQIEFSKILACIEELINSIKILKTQSGYEAVGGTKKAHEIISIYQAKIGMAFLENKDFKQAHHYLQAALKGGYTNASIHLSTLQSAVSKAILIHPYDFKPMLSTNENNDENVKEGNIYLKRLDEKTIAYAFFGPAGEIHRGLIYTSYLKIEEFSEQLYVEQCRPLLPDILKSIANDNILKSRLEILKVFSKKENIAKAESNESTLVLAAHTVLKIYLSQAKPSEEIDELFRLYQKYLGVTGFELVIQFAKENPEKVTKWRIKLFAFLKTNPNQRPSGKFLDKLLQNHLTPLVHDYCLKEKHLECFNLLYQNVALLSKDTLAKYAYTFLSSSKTLPENIQLQAQKWLEEAALSELKTWTEESSQNLESSVVFLYLEACHMKNNRKLFNSKINISILEAALKIKELKPVAHFFYGEFFDEGYSVKQNNVLALEHYKAAAALNHTGALYNLSGRYHKGQGVKPDLEQALIYCRRAFEMKFTEAGIYLAELLREKSARTKSTEHLQDALAVLNVTTSLISDSQFHPITIQHLHGKVAKERSFCLLHLSHPQKPNQPGQLSYLANARNAFSPQIIKNLKLALDSDTLTSKQAALILADLYLYGSHIEKNLETADEYFQKVLDLNETENYYDADVEAYVMMIRSFICNMESAEEKDEENKKILQSKAFQYYQRAMAIGEENFPLELLNQFDNFYQIHSSSTLQNSPISSIIALSSKLQEYNLVHWSDHLSALEKILNEEKPEGTADKILELTKHIEGLGEHLLNATHLFPKLNVMVQTFAQNARGLDTPTLLHIFEAVGKWHLSESSDALRPLLMYVSHRTMNFSEWSQAIKIFSQCGLSQTAQQTNILPLLTPLISKDFTQWATATPTFISDTSRFCHALALLDSHQLKENTEVKSEENPYENCEILALKIFEQLRSRLQNTDQIGFYNVSQLYHAHQYFSRRYPNGDWSTNDCLKKRFGHYENLLKKDTAVHPSKTQEKIYILLKSRFPHISIQHEPFVEGGRRPDYLFENQAIECDGTCQHAYYNNSGNIALPSAKSILRNETLSLAGYEVTTLTGAECSNFLANPSLLDKKFPFLKKANDLAAKAASAQVVIHPAAVSIAESHSCTFLSQTPVPTVKSIPPVTIHAPPVAAKSS